MKLLRTIALVLAYLLTVSAILWLVKVLVLLSVPTFLIVLGCAGCVLLFAAASVLAFRLVTSPNNHQP